MIPIKRQEFSLFNNCASQCEDVWRQDKIDQLRNYRFSDDLMTACFGPLIIVTDDQKTKLPTLEIIQKYMYWANGYIGKHYNQSLQPVENGPDYTHLLYVVEQNFQKEEWGAFLQPNMGVIQAAPDRKVHIGALVVNTKSITAEELELTLQHEIGHVIDWCLGINNYQQNRAPGSQHSIPVEKSRLVMNDWIEDILEGSQEQAQKRIPREIIGVIQEQLRVYCEDPMEQFTTELMGAYYNCSDPETARWITHSGYTRLLTILRTLVKNYVIKKKSAQAIYLASCDLFADRTEWQKLSRGLGRRFRVLS